MQFLGRSEEQKRFREILKQVRPGKITNWRQLLFRDVKDLWPRSASKQPNQPFLVMFYGEGGMGKSSLIQRLHEIAQQESPYKDRFRTVYLDWEERRNNVLGLQVGYRNIEPEAVLEVLYATLKQKLAGRNFREYEQTRQRLKAAKEKAEKALKESKQTQKLKGEIVNWTGETAARVIRQVPFAEDISSKSLEPILKEGIKVSAEGLYQLRQFVQNAMKASEYEIYAQPRETLAAALGRDIAAIATKKPLIIFLDTYEVVDRHECDYTLRRVIQESGNGVVWVVAGRSNLADSGLRGKVYFRGYRQDFPEERLYAKPMSEFGSEDIQTYFQKKAPERFVELTDTDFQNIAEFSLGIPLVVSEIAAMWKDGAFLEEILKPSTGTSGETAHQKVINQTSERFLFHCFSPKEAETEEESKKRETDLQTIYAMAMMRRPDPELLKVMLKVEDLEVALQSLRQQYGFVEIEQGRLHDKLEAFLWEYLLVPTLRQEQKNRQLHRNAIKWLNEYLKDLTKGIADTAEQLQEDKIAETIADKLHHKFWLSEEEGWQYLIPRFVEAWQYDRTQARNLLEVVESFRISFNKDSHRRWKLLDRGMDAFADPKDVEALLAELEKLAERGWLDREEETEQQAILQFKHGALLYRQEKYQQALIAFLEVEEKSPKKAKQLRRNLAEALAGVGSIFAWYGFHKYAENAGNQEEIKTILEKIYSVDSNTYKQLQKLVSQNSEIPINQSSHYQNAIVALQKSVDLERNPVIYSQLSEIYQQKGNYEEAIAAGQKALDFESKSKTKNYFKNVINLFKKLGGNYYTQLYNNLGNAYSNQGKYEQAIAAYQQALEIDPNSAYAYFNLGLVYSNQGNYEQAIAAYQQGLEIDPNDASAYIGLGNAYSNQGKYEQAIAAYQQALEIDPNDANAYGN
ncbi:tetratricopeptide repeat protein, partial [Geitlerinema sp. PCC 9228]|uniref:tetratricopeptide repeat protein n=1 Tax=Geitlerinema sp. PCC 9228 TaxID=111611 RepID=UPI000AB0093E